MTMGWRTAFILQGQSDFKVFNHLLYQSGIEVSHQLHYLQMATEKIAKGLTAVDEIQKPPRTHQSLILWIRAAKVQCRTELMEFCKCRSKLQFRAYLDSLLPLAELIEELAPAVADARSLGVNAEYSWLDNTSNSIQYPAQFPFPKVGLKSPKMIKFLEFINASLKFGAMIIR